jgi:hypothetical protein
MNIATEAAKNTMTPNKNGSIKTIMAKTTASIKNPRKITASNLSLLIVPKNKLFCERFFPRY